jgi:hypothetical protein
MTSKVAPAATFWPRATAIFASRPETRAAMSITGAFGFALDQQRLGAYQVPDRQPDNSQKDDHGNDGAGIEPRPPLGRVGARPGRGPVKRRRRGDGPGGVGHRS